jgi:predicted dienelactone hydrolase
MRRIIMKHLLLAAGLLLLGCYPAGAAGFQWVTVPDPEDVPLQVAIWYPSDDQVADNLVGPFDMDVALNGKASGTHHPLVVMSHGTGGMALNSYDTAIALADAGFVVAAVTHTGDNYRDQSAFSTRRQFAGRVRHVSRVIDFMLGAWVGSGSIDPARIGLFGHSAGGTTALITAGGIADLSLVRAFCTTHEDDWGCRQARQRGFAGDAGAPVSGRDSRIKAIVVAAPALAVAFQPAGLAAVHVPVQLWVSSKDEIVRDASLIRTLLSVPPDYHLVQSSGHFAYLSPCCEILERAAPEICKDPDGFDRAAFLGEFHSSVIAFYRERLR